MDDLYNELERILVFSNSELIVHGYNSSLTYELEKLTDKYDERNVFENLCFILENKNIKDDIIGYLLRWIASSEYSNNSSMKKLYKKYLFSDNSDLRDCATISISISREISLLPDLMIAHEKETDFFVKKYMKEVIETFK